jgi:hypothetical protein
MRKLGNQGGETGLQELTRIQEFDVVVDGLFHLVLVNLKPSNCGDVAFCGLCNDIEGPPLHLAIPFHAQQVAVVVLEVVEEYWHGGLVQLQLIVAVSAHNATEPTIDVVVVSTLVSRRGKGFETKLTVGSWGFEMIKVGNWKHGLICM